MLDRQGKRNIIGVMKYNTCWTHRVIENASKLYLIHKYTKDKIKKVPKQIGCEVQTRYSHDRLLHIT
jgi:hypothetical protein